MSAAKQFIISSDIDLPPPPPQPPHRLFTLQYTDYHMLTLKANALLLCFCFFNLRIYVGVVRRDIPSDDEKILKNTSENKPFPGLSAQFQNFFLKSLNQVIYSIFLFSRLIDRQVYFYFSFTYLYLYYTPGWFRGVSPLMLRIFFVCLNTNISSRKIFHCHNIYLIFLYDSF